MLMCVTFQIWAGHGRILVKILESNKLFFPLFYIYIYYVLNIVNVLMVGKIQHLKTL